MNLKKLIFAVALAIFAPFVMAAETPPLEFVSTYLNGLIELNQVQSEAQTDQKSDANSTMANCVHSGTALQLVLRGQINVLNDITLKAASPLDTLPADLSTLYSKKRDLYQQMTDICAAMLAGPKPGVDYNSMLAEMPKIRAQLEYVDHTLTMESVLVAATLIDKRPDSHNHLNHLVITRDERARLVDDIKLNFGKSLNAKDQNSSASQAGVIYDFLTKKNYFCADEPWQ